MKPTMMKISSSMPTTIMVTMLLLMLMLMLMIGHPRQG